jgi:hypothetical protein
LKDAIISSSASAAAVPKSLSRPRMTWSLMMLIEAGEQCAARSAA